MMIEGVADRADYDPYQAGNYRDFNNDDDDD